MIKIAFSGALKVKKIMEENPVDLHKWTPSPSGGKREWCFLDPSYFLVANISLLNAIFQLRPLSSFSHEVFLQRSWMEKRHCLA